MDFGIRTGKSLSLGMPKAPQGKFKDNQKTNLGDAFRGIPKLRLLVVLEFYLGVPW